MSSIETLLDDLFADPDREPVASEIQVLQSIYGDDAIRPWTPENSSQQKNTGTIRYEVNLYLPAPYHEVPIRVLVSLPPTYPASSSPQLQLLSRYIGPYGADSALFGSILRTFLSVNGVEWTPDTVCVFDGLQNVIERVTTWYEERINAEKLGEMLREDASRVVSATSADSGLASSMESVRISEPGALPAGLEIVQAEPIMDRKSAFVGRACRITDPSQIPLVLAHLLADRRIARAAHPVINAWRCRVGGLIHQDNDDDGETAAGGRLAHLLQILEVNNVLVVVTRYFGGIHLGPDRFKHINQAARNALELGGFLDEHHPTEKKVGRVKHPKR